jgi:quinolinate synthase
MHTAQTAALLSLLDPQVRLTTDPIWEKISHLVPAELWVDHAPIIYKILALKRDQNILILAHNYQNISIIEGIADIVGDSLQLANAARSRSAAKIVVCGVYFMAEMVKLLNPGVPVISPEPGAGCSLADGITAADIAALRASHPAAAVVTYVNTSAAVKAASDVCCTSSNALEIVEALPHQEIIFLPDRHLASYVQRHTKKTIIPWRASCEVHDTLSVDQIHDLRRRVPDIKILAHPECNAAVQLAADFVGSTAALADYVARHKPPRVALLTECAMRDTIAARSPHTTFIQPCALCRHMQKITLPSILNAILAGGPQVILDDAISHDACRALERMLELSRSPR